MTDDSLWIDEPTYRLLVRWAQWARGHHLPVEFWVMCGSIESRYLADAGDVMQDSEARLSKALESTPEPVSDYLAMEVEKIVMRLPAKHRMALRLHYVAHHRIPKNQKRRMLGVSHDGYPGLVRAASLMVRNRLTQRGICGV